MKCPVCESNMSALLCSCGYDASRDYTKYPTFGPVGKALSPSALRARRAPKDALRCEKCSGTAFTIRVPDGSRVCQSCGWSPDPKAHIECACGGRYFLVRASDDALICPLCGKVIPPKDRKLLSPEVPKVSVSVKEQKPPEISTPTFEHLLRKAKGDTPAVTAIAAGACHTVALYADGRVRAVGDGTKTQCHVHRWENITAIAVGNFHTVGLKRDGTVVATGSNSSGQCNVHKWTGIVAIAAGAAFTLGLTQNGTLVIAGENYGYYDALKMRGLKAISAGPAHITGLRINGIVVSSCPVTAVQNKLAQWRDITALSSGAGHIVGLRSTAIPLAAGENKYGQCFVDWTGIKAIAAGHNHTVGLRKNGSVIAAGDNRQGQCNVSGWSDITAIAAGQYHTVGLKKDGTLVSTGDNKHGQCDVEALCGKGSPPKEQKPAPTPPRISVVAAPMSGRIVKVCVKTGDQVKKGQVLVVLEAMMLHNEITAPKDATVAKVLVSRGSTVYTGNPLVELV